MHILSSFIFPKHKIENTVELLSLDGPFFASFVLVDDDDVVNVIIVNGGDGVVVAVCLVVVVLAMGLMVVVGCSSSVFWLGFVAVLISCWLLGQKSNDGFDLQIASNFAL